MIFVLFLFVLHFIYFVEESYLSRLIIFSEIEASKITGIKSVLFLRTSYEFVYEIIVKFLKFRVTQRAIFV